MVSVLIRDRLYNTASLCRFTIFKLCFIFSVRKVWYCAELSVPLVVWFGVQKRPRSTKSNVIVLCFMLLLRLVSLFILEFPTWILRYGNGDTKSCGVEDTEFIEWRWHTPTNRQDYFTTRLKSQKTIGQFRKDNKQRQHVIDWSQFIFYT